MLTAAEWNERYPTDTPALWQQPSGVRPVACIVIGTARERGGLAFVTVVSGVGGVPNSVLLAQLTPLATDEQRRAEGWLDPPTADKLRPDRRPCEHYTTLPEEVPPC